MQVVCWAVTMYFVLLGWLIFRVTNLEQFACGHEVVRLL